MANNLTGRKRLADKMFAVIANGLNKEVNSMPYESLRLGKYRITRDSLDKMQIEIVEGKAKGESIEFEESKLVKVITKFFKES